ncbi:hypothetical protein EG327_002839 [Venturia inaequalis]|uniref:Choline transport protein n=1 Tax=Venturia inaequalis TaxID=5025 RepID=A0A8H3U284_VENIN|nr:hypothetical protein EG327_002839 [Venturia inaequalis]
MADFQIKNGESDESVSQNEGDVGFGQAEIINASGHKQEVDRNFGFWSICALSVCADNAWAAGGGSMVVAFYNGGAPGIIYEFIAACAFYCCIGAALAELSSAIPSSSSVYHWASVTAGPKYGRIASFYAGWWNVLAWIFGTASVSLFGANAIIACWSVQHPEYFPERWHIFLAYLFVTWLACGTVMFGHSILPKILNFGAFLCISVWFVTVMVLAIMPSKTGKGYASNSFVWKDWNNATGYSSSGFVFLAGMLNGAFAIGTPDGCTHLAEEIPDPKRNIPKGILAQLVIGIVTTFTFYLAVLYAITDFNIVLNSSIVALPLAEAFHQGTNSVAGATGLLAIFVLDIMFTIPGGFVTCGRMLWTIARDDATPFAGWLGKIDKRFRNPFNATLICGCCTTILGCIFVGSQTAFAAFVGVFTILTTMSYLAAIMPHIMTARKYVEPSRGPFWMPGIVGYLVTSIACAYIVVFNIIYMFPYSLPTDAAHMNYSSLIAGGLTIFISLWYLWKRNHGYIGPRVLLQANNEVAKAILN